MNPDSDIYVAFKYNDAKLNCWHRESKPLPTFASTTHRKSSYLCRHMRETNIFKLTNGIRVAHQHITTTEIVHCGIFLEIGSRDEHTANQGIAHFWEHMAFKGTTKRKAFHINNSLESIGGELNAYTEKEKVVFYASVRKEYFERAIDIISDIAFHSVFPEHELEKERGVILEEMSMYRDDPEDSLQDEFESVVFRGHPMGMNILGTEETVGAFSRKDFISFVSNNLDTHRIVFACAGNVSADEVEAMSKKYLEPIREKTSKRVRKKFVGYKAREIVMQRNVKQARCGIGREAFSLKNKSRIPFFMLVNYLGGPGLNSRLNYLLREKRGLVYSADAHFAAYSDTGLFSIYFGTEPRQLAKCMTIIDTEMQRLCDTAIGIRQLAALKEQLKGQMALGEESNLSHAMMMGRSILDFGRVASLKEVQEKLDAVDASALLHIAQQMFVRKNLCSLIMEPTKNS